MPSSERPAQNMPTPSQVIAAFLSFILLLMPCMETRGFTPKASHVALAQRQHFAHRDFRTTAATLGDPAVVLRLSSEMTKEKPGPSSEQQAPMALEDVYIGDLSEFFAGEVLGNINIPFLPAPIASYALEQVFERLRTDLSPEVLIKLREFLLSEKTGSVQDDVKGEELKDLAHDVAGELNKGIDLPFLNEEQEREILDQVCSQLFWLMFTSQNEFRKKTIKMGIQARGDILRSAESRAALVEKVNQSIDIPFLNEDYELKLLTTAVDKYAEILESILPASLINTLTGQDPDSLSQTKEYLVDAVNNRVNIPGLSEEREKELISTLIDIYINEYVDGTEAEFLFLSENEKKEELAERCAILERKLLFSERRYEREQKNLSIKLEGFQKRLEQME